ncbi:MAG: hypothetical protein K6U74_01675 [Firmicutes bacterium]|nr:hypothetical protein [Bacillota bacterium]
MGYSITSGCFASPGYVRQNRLMPWLTKTSLSLPGIVEATITPAREKGVSFLCLKRVNKQGCR